MHGETGQTLVRIYPGNQWKFPNRLSTFVIVRQPGASLRRAAASADARDTILLGYYFFYYLFFGYSLFIFFFRLFFPFIGNLDFYFTGFMKSVVRKYWMKGKELQSLMFTTTSCKWNILFKLKTCFTIVSRRDSCQRKTSPYLRKCQVFSDSFTCLTYMHLHLNEIEKTKKKIKWK